MRDEISSRVRQLPAGMGGGRAPDFALVVYDGAFDPPHPGHGPVIRRVLFCAERVALVPSHHHTSGKRVGDFELRCRWLARLARRIDPRWVYYEPIEAGLMPDHLTVYSINLLETLATRSGLTSAQIALLIGADNEAEPPRFERAAGLYWRFDRPVAKERLPLHSSIIRQRLREGLTVPEAWCPLGTRDELHCYGGKRQAVRGEK